ncbi:MAG: PEP-CTERM sorting domain-containing protein [Roseofilum sp. SBFL]|nr:MULTISPECIES: PEP-CTERM sorting domain-containing protein [unclassified Roseofilum]MBP0012234.1 PEP-CTERM sorting domain-containing protein [Roseofilum sp. SID3]MBP0025765.1 PEP-CTERM sorting domain-containing protein [Roseofilum sp. SID2]MBP0036847.1 PEP-CTERM sorting domain-containing protein [Roseofilum sp. SID1]MBP0044145.1 PEP-CTERM sorting domain-containing protein [Roseofilum sp. SBFL]
MTDASGSIAEYTFQTEVVPEPTTVGGLLVLGLVGLGKMASRKRKGV